MTQKQPSSSPRRLGSITRRWRWVPAVAGMAMLGACSGNSAPTGKPTILSLNPCTDVILAEVADRDQIAALSAYSRDPAQSSMDVALARQLPSTTGSLEEVLALRPRTVIAGSFMPPATAAALRRLGMQVELVPGPRTVADSVAQVQRIAKIAGHPERGASLVARIEAALAKAAPPAGSKPISAVVWQAGGMVPGKNELITELMTRSGFSSLSAARGMQQATILPLEAMLADPPQVILAAGHSAAQENRLLAHPALAALHGTRRVAFDPALEWCGGPTIARAVARLAEVREWATVSGYSRHPRVGGDPSPELASEKSRGRWIPAYAGMTKSEGRGI